MFKQLSKKIIAIKVFVISMLVVLTFSGSNVLAVHSDKIEEAIKQIDVGRSELRFEKDFLTEYLKSDYNFGELFESKMCNYILKKTSSFQVGNVCSAKVADRISCLDFAKCIVDYLEDKYIMGSDTTGISDVYSRVLTLEELEANQRKMYLELNALLSLVKDEDAQKFILANAGISENMANYIFSSRLFKESVYRRQAKKVLVRLDPSKEPFSRITYCFLNASDELVFDTSVSQKIHGAQFGGILSINPSTGVEEKRYFKTHQNGSRFTGFTGELYFSKSVSVAQPVNIIELFIYKLFERLGMGPEVEFVVNPFVPNDIYIVTKDLGDKFNIAGNISSGECLKLKDDKEMICKLTNFDLFNRILGIDDLNPGNYGVLDNGTQKLIKVIDFRAPRQTIPLNEVAFRSYFSVNGDIYHPRDRVVNSLLKNKSREQKIQEGKEAIESLELSIEEFRGIVLDVKRNIQEFVDQADAVNGLTVKEQIGLYSSGMLERLTDYVDNIVINFEFVKSYFERNLAR